MLTVTYSLDTSTMYAGAYAFNSSGFGNPFGWFPFWDGVSPTNTYSAPLATSFPTGVAALKPHPPTNLPYLIGTLLPHYGQWFSGGGGTDDPAADPAHIWVLYSVSYVVSYTATGFSAPGSLAYIRVYSPGHGDGQDIDSRIPFSDNFLGENFAAIPVTADGSFTVTITDTTRGKSTLNDYPLFGFGFNGLDPYKVFVDTTLPLGSSALITITAIDIIAVCFDAKVLTRPPPPPIGLGNDAIVEGWRYYWEADVGASGALAVGRGYAADSPLVAGFQIDNNTDCAQPDLVVNPDTSQLSVIYRRGKGTPTDLFTFHRRVSEDDGATWNLSHGASATLTTTAGIPYMRQVFNRRTGEYLLIYNDGSGTTSGTGLLQVNIYDAMDALIGTFPAGGAGIGGLTADNDSFGAEYFDYPTSAIGVSFTVGSVKKQFRSYDDGRTWSAMGTSIPIPTDPAAAIYALTLGEYFVVLNGDVIYLGGG